MYFFRLLLCIAFGLSTPSVSNAQNGKKTPCNTYDCMFQQARDAFKRGDFVLAFKKFASAKGYNTHAKTASADREIEVLF